MTREETWNGERIWGVEAHYFELLAAPAAVDIKIFGQDGEVLADDRGVKPGYFHDRRGLEPFKSVVITNSSSQAVKGLFSDGLSGTKSFSPQWYDRNPVEKTNHYASTLVAPHGSTSRWSYTVPSGKKYMWQFAQCRLMRDAAAAPVGFAACRIGYTPSGGSVTYPIYAVLQKNAVGDADSSALTGTATILAGAAIEGITNDASTGGTITYINNQAGIEFDA